MRPDEHKRTKNARYKKKHGMSSDQVSENPSNKREQVAEKKKTKNIPHQIDSKPENVNSSTVQIPEISSYGFSKRPVESNWERYEPTPDSEEDHGEDFNVLLSFAGFAASHMKLKSEEEWDSQEDFSFFNLDQNLLVESIKDVPFVEKYKLADLNLNSNILEYFSNLNDSTLSMKSEILRKRTLSDNLSSQLGFNFSQENSFNESKPVVHEDLPTTVTQDVSNIVLTNDVTDTPNEISNDKTIDANDLAVVTALLKTDNASKFDKIPDTNLTMKEGVSEAQNMSDGNKEPSSVVSSITENSNEHEAFKTTNAEAEKPSDNAVDDLEDWLDSIL